MHPAFPRALIFALVITATTCSGFSQEPARQPVNESSLPDAPRPSQKEIILGMPKDILHDQAGIWTSLARIRTKDLVWLAPLAVAAGVSIATDYHTMSSVVSHDPDFNNANLDAANGLTSGLIGRYVIHHHRWHSGQIRTY